MWISTLLLSVATLVLASHAFTRRTTTPPPDPKLSFNSDVTRIEPSVTSDLRLTCEMTAVGLAGKENMVSLVLSKFNTENNKFEELVTLTMFNRGKPNVIKNVGAVVSGYLDTNSTSYIKMHWTFPGRNEAARYSCDSNTVNVIGLPVTRRATLDITAMDAPTDDLTETIRQMKDSIRNLTETVGDLTREVSIQRSSLQTVRNYFYDLSKKVQDMTETVFHKSFIRIDGHQLVWSKSPYYSYESAQAMCTLIGGKLAEIRPQAFFSRRKDMMGQGYDAFTWLGALYVNGTTYYPSTGSEVDFRSPVNPSKDQCMLLNQNVTTVYYTDCRSAIPYHALCTVG